MTIQLSRLTAKNHGKSKAVLQTALNTVPDYVCFDDPSIFPGARGCFTGASMQFGEHFPVVMDPDKRMRFAIVTRKADGSFKVS